MHPIALESMTSDMCMMQIILSLLFRSCMRKGAIQDWRLSHEEQKPGYLYLSGPLEMEAWLE